MTRSLILTEPKEVSQVEKQLAEEAKEIEMRANTLVIDSDAMEATATDFLSIIATNKKSLEEQRKFFVDPLNKQVKAINERFKLYSEPLDRADKIIRGKVLEWRRKKELKRQEEEQKARELAEEEAAKLAIAGVKMTVPVPAPMVPEPPKMVRTSLGSASTKKVWTFRIVDESLIPREYLMVDTKKIAAVVKAGIRQIPGVEIFQEEQLAVRARTFA